MGGGGLDGQIGTQQRSVAWNSDDRIKRLMAAELTHGSRASKGLKVTSRERGPPWLRYVCVKLPSGSGHTPRERPTAGPPLHQHGPVYYAWSAGGAPGDLLPLPQQDGRILTTPRQVAERP